MPDLYHERTADLGCLSLSGEALGGCKRWIANGCEAFRRGAAGGCWRTDPRAYWHPGGSGAEVTVDAAAWLPGHVLAILDDDGVGNLAEASDLTT